MFKILKENFAYKFDADSAILTFSVEVRIIRNPYIFGPFDRPKNDAPNPDTRIHYFRAFFHYFRAFFRDFFVIV